MQVIMLVNDKKFVNKGLNVSCNIWHSLGIVKTIDSGDNNVDVTRKKIMYIVHYTNTANFMIIRLY